MGARAWKGFDWETLNRLHEKGYISNPVGKAKSVGVTEKGFLKAKEFFEKHFTKELTILPVPKLTGAAKNRWSQVPEKVREDIMDNVWCTRCRTGTSMLLREGKMLGRSLVLSGTCMQCGMEISRVIEPDEE